MPEKNQKSWKGFSVGTVSKTPNWTNSACAPLESVAHVTHVRSAVEIVRMKGLVPGLIFDESRLNTSRILVNWLSPNDWTNAGGFRYGNVAFRFSWTDLIHGMNAYWVGTMDYSPTACRILLTDQNRDSELLPYDAERGDGPWWFDRANDRHYWNGNLCMEFMLERKLRLTEVASIEFVRHNRNQCCIDPNTCADRGQDESAGGGRFIAACIGERLALKKRLFTRKKNGNRRPNPQLKTAWEGIYNLIRQADDTYEGNVRNAQRSELARAALAALGRRDDDGAATLLGLFASRKDVVDACAEVIESDLGVPTTLDRTA